MRKFRVTFMLSGQTCFRETEACTPEDAIEETQSKSFFDIQIIEVEEITQIDMDILTKKHRCGMFDENYFRIEFEKGFWLLHKDMSFYSITFCPFCGCRL